MKDKGKERIRKYFKVIGKKEKEGKRKEHEQKDGDRGCNKENAQMRNGCAVLFGCTLVGGVCKLRSV